MKVQSQQSASLDQPAFNQEHFEAEIDLNIQHRFSKATAFDKAASFTMDRKQIYQELVSFVSDRMVPDMILGMRPEWEQIPPIVNDLNTSSQDRTKTKFEISSDNIGFTYKGKIYFTSDTSSDRQVQFAESIYNIRGSIGTTIANAVTQALRDHFFEVSKSTDQTNTRTNTGPDGTRVVERHENWQRPGDNLGF